MGKWLKGKEMCCDLGGKGESTITIHLWLVAIRLSLSCCVTNLDPVLTKISHSHVSVPKYSPNEKQNCSFEFRQLNKFNYGFISHENENILVVLSVK